MNRLVAAAVALLVVCVAAVWSEKPAADPPPLPVAVAGPKWWKGNLHTHTLWSDGDDYPEMVADWYKRHGYDFLALTDHNLLAEGERWVDAASKKAAAGLARYRSRFGDHWVEMRQKDGTEQVRLKPLAEFRSLLEEPGKFLLVPAEEVSAHFDKAPIHINAINLRDPLLPTGGASRPETITVNLRAIAEQQKKTGQSMLSFLNHPNFGWALRAEDLAAAEDLRYFEVFNGHPGVHNDGDAVRAGCERIWDIVLALRLSRRGGQPLLGLATDDAHGYHAFGVGKVNPGRGWVMVRAPHLTAESLVRAMHEGRFYSTTGVVLNDVKRLGSDLTISIKAEPGVTYRTEFIATLRGTALEAQPARDAQGNPVATATGVYSAEVGKVVDTVEGPEATYKLTGRELYVRAKITSTKPHPNPFRAGDVEVAWTQPIVP